MTRVSIIMPVFKVEKYLDKAIKSILSQKETSWELFLVDDGSPDLSGEICDKYAKYDSRIKVIHKNNEGAAIARNTAMPLISGEYVAFYDSDDWIEDNCLSEMYDIAKNNNLDLLIAGFFIDTYDKKTNNYFTLNYIPPKEKIYSDKLLFRKEAYEYFDINMFYSPWNKLYKKEYLIKNNILFKNTYRDDFPFVLDVIKDISNIGFIKKQYYHFLRQREDSETQKYVKNLYEKREEEHKWMVDLYKYWNLYDDKNSLDMISRRYIDRIIECIVNYFNKNSLLNKHEIKNNIKNILNNNNLSYALNNSNPKKIYLKIMYIPFRLRNIFLCYIECKIIYFIKNNFSLLFNKLKFNR